MSNDNSVLVLQDLQHGSSAKILPGKGFNCFSFQVPMDGSLVEVLSSEPGFESCETKGTRSGIPWLFPFPNRIQEGKYSWEGREFQLPVADGRGNAIHGFVVDRPWRVTTADESTAIAEFQLSLDAPDRRDFWPGDFLFQVQYRLYGACLRAEIRIVNAGDKPLPWGLGTHPYFRIPLAQPGDASRCQVQVPAIESWELKDFIPTGRRLAVDSRTDLRSGVGMDNRTLDDVLTGLEVEEGRTLARVIDHQLGYRVTQIADAVFRDCVVFTPPGRPCVCLEPYTCTTNAINLQQRGIDAGLRVLAPGAEFHTWIEIRVDRIPG